MPRMPWTNHDLTSWSELCSCDSDERGVQVLNDFRSQHALVSHRPLFIGQNWLESTLIAAQSQVENYTCELKRLRERLKTIEQQIKNCLIAQEIVTALSNLPEASFPEIPVDVCREIFEWAARSQPPWSLTLVSKEVLSWVDPIIFPKELNWSNWKMSFNASSRFIRPGIQQMSIFRADIAIQPEDFNAVVRTCPRLETLSIHSDISHGGSETPNLFLSPQAIPTLRRLHCDAAIFGSLHPTEPDDNWPVADLSSPIFQSLTVLSLDLNCWRTKELSTWSWSLQNSTSLLYLWLDMWDIWPDDILELPYLLQTQMLPDLPLSLEIVVVNLGSADLPHSTLAILQPFVSGQVDQRLVFSACKAHLGFMKSPSLAPGWRDDGKYWAEAVQIVKNRPHSL